MDTNIPFVFFFFVLIMVLVNGMGRILAFHSFSFSHFCPLDSPSLEDSHLLLVSCSRISHP